MDVTLLRHGTSGLGNFAETKTKEVNQDLRRGCNARDETARIYPLNFDRFVDQLF